jgi:hypothetical protein
VETTGHKHFSRLIACKKMGLLKIGKPDSGGVFFMKQQKRLKNCPKPQEFSPAGQRFSFVIVSALRPRRSGWG